MLVVLPYNLKVNANVYLCIAASWLFARLFTLAVQKYFSRTAPVHTARSVIHWLRDWLDFIAFGTPAASWAFGDKDCKVNFIDDCPGNLPDINFI